MFKDVARGIAEAVGDILQNGIGGLFGLDETISDWLTPAKEKEVNQLLNDVARLRSSRKDKLDKVQEAIDMLSSRGISIPGALSAALEKERLKYRKQYNQLSSADEAATQLEERLISRAERGNTLGEVLSRSDSEVASNSTNRDRTINNYKENINAIQEKFSEERL